MEHGEKMILLLLSLLNTEARPQKQGAPICQKLQCKRPFRESASQTHKHTHRPNSIPKRRRRQINKNTQIEYCWEHVHHSYLYHRGHLRDKRVHIKRKDHETQQSAQKAKTRWSSLLFLLLCWGMPSQICCCNFNFDRLTFVVRSTASKRSCHRGHWADKRGLII